MKDQNVRLVDDKRYCINLINQIIKEPLTVSMTKSVNMWEELLSFIGDKLELTKCDYYILECEFDFNEKSQLKILSHPSSSTIQRE